jgi:hypothetical protein
MSVTIIPERQPAPDAVTRRLAAAAASSTIDRASRRRAIAALPVVAAPDVAARTLAQVATDTGADDDVRTIAAESLGRVDSDATAAILVRLVRDEVPGVAGAAATALGRGAGAPADLATLADVARSRRGVVADRARFAAALIAHRFDVAGFDPQPLAHHEPLPATARARPATVTDATVAEAALARKTVAEAMPRLPLRGPALQVRCAGRTHMLLVADDAAPVFTAPSRFAERRRYVGQLAFRNPTNGRYSPGLAILATPGPAGVELGLYRADGTVVLAGTGQLDAATFVASLTTTARPGAVAVSARGVVTPTEIRLDIRSDTTRAIEPLRPTPAVR